MATVTWGCDRADFNGVGGVLMPQLHEPTNLVMDSLRMSERDLLRVLGTLAGPASESPRTAAVSCSVVANYPRVVARLRDQFTGAWNTYLVKPRTIHEHGMTFLHGGYVHRGVRSDALLRNTDGQAAQIAGSVAMCRHVSGRLHEVVVTFDRPIVLKNYKFADGSALSSPSLWHEAQVQSS